MKQKSCKEMKIISLQLFLRVSKGGGIAAPLRSAPWMNAISRLLSTPFMKHFHHFGAAFRLK
jgi:hypothetical protein